MTEYKRIKCPSCGNVKTIHEESDKSQVLYYSMQGTPVYKKVFKCGECGDKFEK